MQSSTNKLDRGHTILGDQEAVSRDDRMFVANVYYKIEILY